MSLQDLQQHMRGRVLVVEDDSSTADYLVATFREAGHEAMRADSGEDALQVLRKDRDIGAVLLDLMMPGTDGFEILSRIRRSDDLRETPVIIVTARDSVRDRIRALEGGADDYLTKPFESAELMARLGAVLREHSLRKELHERLAELESRNEELANLSALKDQFLAIASHDLRSPLTNIKGYTDLLLHGALGEVTEDQKKALHVVLKNCGHLLETIAKLLDVSRLDAGEFHLTLGDHDLSAIVAACVTSYAPQAECKQIDLEAHLSDESLYVVCDEERITSVMNNLLSNAVKFCRPGDKVDVRLERDGGNPRVTVRDTGPGIPHDEQPMLFTRFAKLSVRPTGGEKSVGLGLALVKEIVELHGGKVSAQCKPGEGCAFSFAIPRDGPPEAAAADSP